MKQHLLSTTSKFALGFWPKTAFKNPGGAIHMAEKTAILVEPTPVMLIREYLKRGWKIRVDTSLTKGQANDILFPWMKEEREALEVASA